MPVLLVPGRIVWARISDPAGRNPKQRGIVVLDHRVHATGEIEVTGVAVTGTFPKPLPADHIALQWQRDRRVRTLLDKPSAAVCSWIVHQTFTEADITLGGFIDGKLLEVIIAKVNELTPPEENEAGPQGTSDN